MTRGSGKTTRDSRALSGVDSVQRQNATPAAMLRKATRVSSAMGFNWSALKFNVKAALLSPANDAAAWLKLDYTSSFAADGAIAGIRCQTHNPSPR